MEEKTQFDVQLDKEIVVLTRKTVEYLISKNPDSLVLYLFYIKNAKQQETNQIFNTNTFGMNGLGWGKKRYQDAKNILLDEGFIETVEKRDGKGKFNKRYIKINYLWKQETIQRDQNPPVDTPTSGYQETNALSNININALSNKKEMLTAEEQPPQQENNLPTSLGKTKLVRILTLYSRIWKKKFGFSPKSVNFGKSAGILKSVMANYDEQQIACLLLTHFSWYGATGDNPKEYQFISGKGFPLEMLSKNCDVYEAFLRNKTGIKFDDPGEVKLYLIKNIKDYI